MKVRVKLFARARELAQADFVVLELSPPATIADLRRELALALPQLKTLAARSTLAVDEEFAEDATPVTENAEVALLPPVSGGGASGILV